MHPLTLKQNCHPECASDEGWRTLVVTIPPGEVAYVSSILEAYDNEFLLRTYDKETGVVCIWHAMTSEALLDRILGGLREEFPVTIVSTLKGMSGLDEVYPE